MIEINLYPGKGTGSGEGSNIDFNSISIKGMIAAFVIYLLVNYGMPMFYGEKVQNWDNQIQEMNTEMASLTSQLSVLGGLKKEIEAAKAEEQLLYEQLNIIKEIMSNKRNPMKILLYLSRNTPENTWITSFKTEGRAVRIEGLSFSYNLIGKFFDSLKSSIFFSGELRLETGSAQNTTEDGETVRRLEQFTITGSVRQFE